MTSIDRRSLLTRGATVVGAAAVTAIPAVGLAKGASEGPSELAALVRRYLSQIASFDCSKWETDEEGEKLAAKTFEATLKQIYGVPVRSNRDAVAALDWIIDDGKGCMIELGGDDSHSDYARVAGWLIASLRSYIARA